MTAITQCPQCGTRFRVVPDQLKISQGWVRCGKCAEVFNAQAALDAAAARTAGQPAPPTSSAVAPHQVSIVLRQQAIGPENAATDVSPSPRSSDGEVPEGQVADDPKEQEAVSSHAPDVREPFDADDSSAPTDDERHVQASQVTDVAPAPTDAVPQPDPVVVSDAAEVSPSPAPIAVDFLIDDVPQPPAWLLRTSVANLDSPEPPPVAELDADEAARTEVAQDAADATAGVSVLQQAVAGWVRADVAQPVDSEESTASAILYGQLDVPDAPIAPDPLVANFAAVSPVAVEVTEPSEAAVAPSSLRSEGATSSLNAEVPDADLPYAAQPDVGFVRQARRQAFWSSGPVRAALGALVVFASALLALQVAVHERNRLAALSPALKPLLVQLCEPIGCEVGLYQHIESVEIISTELIKAKDGSYRFEMALRNQSVLPVALPAVELSLTDRHGDAVLRRVVLPDDWTDAADTLAPQTETALALKLALINPEELRMEGFRAVVFYP